MSIWSKHELRKIVEADDLHISPFREDGVRYGTPTWIWSVAVDDALYVRAYNGQNSRWYQAAVRQKARRIIAAGMTKEVTFLPGEVPRQPVPQLDDRRTRPLGNSQGRIARDGCLIGMWTSYESLIIKSSSTMRRVMVKAFGGPQQLIVESVPDGLRPWAPPLSYCLDKSVSAPSDAALHL
jgi:hypothetical protein